MLNSTPDSTEEFWKLQEKRLECKILSFALAQYANAEYSEQTKVISPKQKQKKVLWGILFISEKGVHFYHFPQRSWFYSLVNKTENSQKEYFVDLNFADIDKWKAPQTNIRFWQRVFNLVDDVLVLICKKESHSFSLDLRKKDIIAHIKNKISAKETPSL